MKEHIIDAEGKSIGRIASDAARILMGKNKIDFARNTVTDDKVVVNNISKLYFEPKKLIQKKYYTHSGYSGSLKEKSLKLKLEEDDVKFFRNTVKRMLPDNRLRDLRLKRLTINK